MRGLVTADEGSTIGLPSRAQPRFAGSRVTSASTAFSGTTGPRRSDETLRAACNALNRMRALGWPMSEQVTR